MQPTSSLPQKIQPFVTRKSMTDAVCTQSAPREATCVQPCTVLVGKYVVAVAGRALGPAVSCAVRRLPAQKGFLGRCPARCMGGRGDGSELLEVSLLDTARACQGLLSGRVFLCNVFSKRDDTRCFSSSPLASDKLIKPTVMFLSWRCPRPLWSCRGL